MTKKRTQSPKLIVSFALALVLCISMLLPVLASPVGDINWENGTESNPAKAAITKVLRMPIGTITPTMTFEFEVSKVSVDGSTLGADLDDMPSIGKVLIPYGSGTSPIVDDGVKEAGVKTAIKESANLFDGKVFPHAGIYVYHVKEYANTFTNTFEEKITDYSEAEYDLYVYVKDGTNGTYVYLAVGVIKVVDGYAGGEAGHKVDPTPGGDPKVEGDYSKMIFTNVYLKNNGGTDPDNTVFKLSKKVTGDYADKSLRFPFKVTVTKPVTVTGTVQDYKAYLMNADGVVSDIPTETTVSGNVGSDSGIEYIKFPSGTDVIVNLKHDEYLSFIDLPVGSSFTATETGTAGYAPKCELTLGSTVVEPFALEGASLTVPASGIAYMTETTNIAAFTNAFKTIVPGGIGVDNLPYIALIALALGGMVAYVLAKSKRNAKGNA